MSHIKYIIGFIVMFSNTLVSNNLANNNFTIHKIDETGDNLILFDASIPGPIMYLI